MSGTEQKVAIVTGASQGIGAAVARRLARDGVAVVANYTRNAEAAARVVGEIAAAGGRAVAVQADAAAADAPGLLFDAAERAFGGADILVNNAADVTIAPVADTDDAAFEAMMALNVTGVFRALRTATRRLREGGRIVNFSSSVVGFYGPGYGPYAASKAAVEALTHVLAKELAPRRITVNAVAPGPTETASFRRGKTDAQVEAITRMIPAGRLARPEEIAEVVAFLASPAGFWVNGQVIRANGGAV